jgi:hypothetical protein
MNWPHAIFWGFVATIVLTTLLSATRALHLTRIDIPFLVGTMFTSHRDRAKWVGFLVHLVNGWIFALIYVGAFHSTGWKNPVFGMLIGLVHSLFVLVAGMTLLPSIHPRMAGEQDGPRPTRQLEPPGFLALNYGRQTPIATILAHLVFGAILGFFY